MGTEETNSNRHPPVDDVPELNQLYFYLTQGCNLACSHCWLSPALDPDGDTMPVLPLAVMRQVISEARPLGLSGVKLTGGEPLLHPDISSILDLLAAEKLALTMETNGVLCTPEITGKIAALPSSFVSVSLDAPDSTVHDRLRRKSGAFARTVEAVRLLTGSNIPTQLIMSIMQCNVHLLEEMISLAEELGVASLKFNLVQPIGRGRSLHDNNQAVSVAELVDLGRRVENELASRTTVPLFFDYPPAFRSLRHLGPDSQGCSACGIFSVLGVLANGAYALCGIGTRIEKLVFGRAGEDRLIDVWRSHPVLLEIRRGLPGRLTGICGRCLLKHHCLGSCLANNYFRQGSLWAPFWFCEQAEQVGLFPASRCQRTEDREQKTELQS